MENLTKTYRLVIFLFLAVVLPAAVTSQSRDAGREYKIHAMVAQMTLEETQWTHPEYPQRRQSQTGLSRATWVPSETSNEDTPRQTTTMLTEWVVPVPPRSGLCPNESCRKHGTQRSRGYSTPANDFEAFPFQRQKMDVAKRDGARLATSTPDI